MKRKQLYILEAVIVILILSILVYTSAPKAVNSQHRAQIAQLEETMQAIKHHLAKLPNDDSILKDNAGSVGMFTSGPSYNQRNQTLTLFHVQRILMDLKINSLEEYDPSIRLPDWTLSELKLAGYAVYPKQHPNQTSLNDYSDIPVYAAVIARVGHSIDDNHFMHEPYHAGYNEQGYLEFNSYPTPFDPSNGLSSYGEFMIDTKDIWSATKAVLLNELQAGFNTQWFPGINMDTVNIIRHGDM